MVIVNLTQPDYQRIIRIVYKDFVAVNLHIHLYTSRIFFLPSPLRGFLVSYPTQYVLEIVVTQPVSLRSPTINNDWSLMKPENCELRIKTIHTSSP